MSYRYKVGDAVKVRDDLECGGGYYMRSGPGIDTTNNSVVPEMKIFKGKVVHIRDSSAGQYKIEEMSICYWTDDMFAGLETNECYCSSLL